MTSELNQSALLTEVQGIEWPALPGAAATTKLAALFQLEQSQWWTETEILKQQFKQIQSLVQHAITHIPYYKESLSSLANLPTITYEQWRQLPVLTRDDVQNAGNDLRTQVLPASHGKAYIQRTSGSTGKPIETLSTDITAFFWNVFTLRDHLWHHRDFSKTLAVIRFSQDEQFNAPHGLHTKNWGKATSNLYNTGDCYTLSILTPISEQIKWLQKIQPYYLLTHPSVLKELALYCKEHNIDLTFLGEVRTISEALPDTLRQLCKEVWNVKLIDLYSTIELGYLALQCPENQHYHVQSENVLLEILDDNNNPCKPGEIGRVVVTTLHNFAFPLIRYELGDYAEVGELCSCGRGLPVIKRILGRYRNLATFPDGTKAWPKFNLSKMVTCAPVKQFQAVQHAIDHVEYFLICERTLTSTETNGLINLFQSNLHPDIRITITEVDTLSRSKNGKYEEFISHV